MLDDQLWLVPVLLDDLDRPELSVGLHCQRTRVYRMHLNLNIVESTVYFKNYHKAT
jgi:hypothetical protein